MKKVCFLMSAIVVLFLGLASLAWAGEVSYFDPDENWIVRAYTQGTNLFIEVLDPSSPTLEPIDIKNISGLSSNPQQVNDAQSPLTSQDISMTGNNKCTIYLFYTTGASAPILNSVTLEIKKVAPNISVDPADTLAFGSVLTGASSTKTVTVTNTGTQNLTLGTIGIASGQAYYSLAGGTCTNNMVLGTSASNNSCIINVQFAPGQSTGTLTGSLSIPSNDKNISLTLTGIGYVQNIACADLRISVLEFSSASSGTPFQGTVTISNQGTCAATNFVTKGTFSSNREFSSFVMYQFTTDSLGAGQSTTKSFSYTPSQLVAHVYYYSVNKVDINNTVAETNESNNSYITTVFAVR